MGRPSKYSSDEERYQANNEYQIAYGKKLLKCESCNIEIRYENRAKHFHTKKHLKNDFKPWRCDICNKDFHPNSKANHLQTKSHKYKSGEKQVKKLLQVYSNEELYESDKRNKRNKECPTCSESDSNCENKEEEEV